MSEQRDVTIAGAGDDVTLEVSVGYEKPASIDVALYGPDRKKERDIGSAFTGAPADPHEFVVQSKGNLTSLQGRTLGVFIAISSFTPAADEKVTVSSQLRQHGSAIANSSVLATGSVQNGGAGIIIAYQLAVV